MIEDASHLTTDPLHSDQKSSEVLMIRCFAFVKKQYLSLLLSLTHATPLWPLSSISARQIENHMGNEPSKRLVLKELFEQLRSSPFGFTFPLKTGPLLHKTLTAPSVL